MVNKLLVIKGVVIVFQLISILFLVLTGFHVKKLQQSREFLELERAARGDVKPFTPEEESFISKFNVRYAILLTVIVLSTLKVPTIFAGIFLNHILVLFGSLIMDAIIAPLYIINSQLLIPLSRNSVTSYFLGSVFALICSVACGIVTIFLIITIRKQTRA